MELSLTITDQMCMTVGKNHFALLSVIYNVQSCDSSCHSFLREVDCIN